MPSRANLRITTAGEIFADGHAIEILRAGTETSLLHWDGKIGTIAGEILYRGRRYLPPPASDGLLHAMRLPIRNESCGSIRRLFAGLHETFNRQGGQPDPAASLAAFFAMGSWLAGAASTALRLEIVGSDAEALRLLEIFACVCRHPLLLHFTSKAELLKIPLELQPIFLIYAPNANRGLRHFLRSPAARGLLVQNSAGKLINLNAPMAFYLGEDVAERSSANGHILLPASPLPAGLPPWTERAELEFAEKFQPLLLNYRLRNFLGVSRSGFDAREITSPLREQVNALAACIVGDDELQRQLVAAVADQDEDSRAERAHTVPAVVDEAGLSFCHRDAVTKVYVGELTEAANVILKSRGEHLLLEPEAVGAQLRRWGIFTERLGKKGRGFYLMEKQRRLLHELARQYDVPSVRNGKKRCEYCSDERQSRKRS